MTVEHIQPKSTSVEDLQDYIAECSSVVRDKQPKSAEKLWNRLLTESYGNTASRVFEYIPCTISAEFAYTTTGLQFFGFWSKQYHDFNDTYHTTARELLNWGWPIEEILPTVDFTNYRAFKCEAPYFIYGQVSTHNQITSVSHSQRYGTCDRGYWMPSMPKWEESWNTIENAQEAYNSIIPSTTPESLKTWFKANNIVRKEVWDRGADMLQNRVFTLGGYIQPNGWTHFIDQRLDSHTQLETREFTQLIKELI